MHWHILYLNTVFREVMMRVWVLRRREGGAYLPEPVRVGGTPAPLELLVVEVTDQGKRGPSRIAHHSASLCDAGMAASRWPNTPMPLAFLQHGRDAGSAGGLCRPTLHGSPSGRRCWGLFHCPNIWAKIGRKLRPFPTSPDHPRLRPARRYQVWRGL